MARVIVAADLPSSPLDAAAKFHADIVPQVRDAVSGSTDLVVAFDSADHTHVQWRLAVMQELAREAAPCRINGVVVQDGKPEATQQVAQYLASASGVTGQMLQVDAIVDAKD